MRCAMGIRLPRGGAKHGLTDTPPGVATIRIISRGKAPSTETKLRQTGASTVILPTQIGAKGIAELI